MPDVPRLRITLAGPNVVLFWPDPSAGFVLQVASVLPAAPASWNAVGSIPAVVNGEKLVTLPHSDGARFYRLAKL